jgi:hypothetical protein
MDPATEELIPFVVYRKLHPYLNAVDLMRGYKRLPRKRLTHSRRRCEGWILSWTEYVRWYVDQYSMRTLLKHWSSLAEES